jgi:hypothetical protein
MRVKLLGFGGTGLSALLLLGSTATAEPRTVAVELRNVTAPIMMEMIATRQAAASRLGTGWKNPYAPFSRGEHGTPATANTPLATVGQGVDEHHVTLTGEDNAVVKTLQVVKDLDKPLRKVNITVRFLRGHRQLAGSIESVSFDSEGHREDIGPFTRMGRTTSLQEWMKQMGCEVLWERQISATTGLESHITGRGTGADFKSGGDMNIPAATLPSGERFDVWLTPNSVTPSTNQRGMRADDILLRVEAQMSAAPEGLRQAPTAANADAASPASNAGVTTVVELPNGHTVVIGSLSVKDRINQPESATGAADGQAAIYILVSARFADDK